MVWASILRIVIFVVVFILIVSILQFIVSIRPKKYYDTHTPEDYGIEYKNISFKTSDKITIRGWLIESEKADGTVIIGHGYPFNKGNIIHVAKFLYPRYNLLFYDHRYFGESDGWITTIGIKETKDVESAIKYVRKKMGKNKSIALYGFSLSAAAMLMTDVEVDAIVSDSAYSNLENMVNAVYAPFGPLKWPFVKITNILSMMLFRVHPRNVSPANAVKDSKIPILIIHATKDSEIPVENAHQIKESNPDIDMWIVANGEHGGVHAMYKEEYEKKVKSFLKKNMGGK